MSVYTRKLTNILLETTIRIILQDLKGSLSLRPVTGFIPSPPRVNLRDEGLGNSKQELCLYIWGQGFLFHSSLLAWYKRVSGLQ